MSRTSVLVLIFCLVSFLAMSQPGDPGGGGNPTVPISGLEFLLGGGVLLGIRGLLYRIKSKDNKL